MRFTYQCELYRNDEGWAIALPDCFARGAVKDVDRDKVVTKAADALKAEVLRLLLLGKPVPKDPSELTPGREGATAILVSVETGGFSVTTAEAAEMLRLTPARITQMVKSGELSGYKEGRNMYVTLSSLRERIA